MGELSGGRAPSRQDMDSQQATVQRAEADVASASAGAQVTQVEASLTDIDTDVICHRWARWCRGSILTPSRIPDEALQQYVKSMEHFADVTRRMNVDVAIQNHPLYDGVDMRLQAFRARKPGQPNPFVVGKESCQRFLSVMRECINAQRERRRT